MQQPPDLLEIKESDRDEQDTRGQKLVLNGYKRDNYQRQKAQEALDGIEPEDWIIINDIDLIKKPNTHWRAIDIALFIPITEYFESLGVSKWEILMKIRIPYSLPYLFAALKVSIPLSIIGAVIGEWFGSSKGLGNLIMVSHGNLDTETLFACIFLLAMLGVIATAAVVIIERRLIFWHPSVGTF